MKSELLVWLITLWGCAGVFAGIGIFAMRRKKPMWFWAGTEVDASTLTDVAAYNRENGRMWLVYSLPFWFSGLLGLFSIVAGAVVLVLACVGIVELIRCYNRILKKYSK